MNEFVRLVEHGDYYFFAGDAVVLYGNKDLGIYKKISRFGKHYKPAKYDYCMFSKKIFSAMK